MPRRLHVALQPILPLRTPDAYSKAVLHGFHLRVANGPLVAPEDPLFRAFGVLVTTLDGVCEHDETVQHDSLDPGRQLELVVEPDEHGCDLVAVWDVERLRRAGALPTESSDVAVAALESGLAYRVVALQEHRSRPDNRRTSLTVVLFAEDFVRLSRASARHYHRPDVKKRRRIVLVADGSPEIRWWDSAADKGPAETGDLPLSPLLVDELSALRLTLDELHQKMRISHEYELYELEMELDELDERGQALWRRARAELVRDYVVGFMGRGMRRPVWTPRDLDDPHEDDELLA